MFYLLLMISYRHPELITVMILDLSRRFAADAYCNACVLRYSNLEDSGYA